MLKILIYPIVVAALTVITTTAQLPDDKSKIAISPAVTRVEGKVISVEEGDRVKFAAVDGTPYTLYLLGIDAPDQKQENFKKARKRLAELAEGKEAVALMYRTSRGDLLAAVYIGRQDVGLRLVQDGLAWFYPAHYATLAAGDRQKYIDAEAAARNSRVGLWEDDEPQAPWTLRGEKIDVAPAVVEADPAARSANTSTPENKVPGRKYLLGPRGGCYYLNDKGHKVYVKDKSLCAQQ